MVLAFRDFSIRFLPSQLLPKLINKFDYGFIVHSRDYSDLFRRYPKLKKLPKFILLFICRFIWPVVVTEIYGPKNQYGEQLKGVIIGVGLTASQLMHNKKLAKNKFISAAKLAKKFDVKILGLGALSASLTRGGLDISEKVKIGITTGHALTVDTVVNHLYSISNLLEIDIKKIKVAIVGAAGSIGSNSAKLLAKDNQIREILLVDVPRKRNELDQLRKTLQNINSNLDVFVSDRIEDIKNYDIIITATNLPDVLIKSEYLKAGAVIIDDAQPTDVSEEVYKLRNDVMVLEGGVVNIKGLNVNFDFGLKNKGDIFSCLGEVIMLSYVGHGGNYNIGKLDFDKVFEVREIKEKIGLTLGKPQNFYKLYNNQDVLKIKNILHKT
ncbi:MAG: hypothetical protein WC768_03395 [Patescibacteria group bacterium]|jgi:predicted amino acid dehydrogenase